MSDNALFQPDGLLHVRDVQRLVQGRTWPPYELPERGILIPKLSALAFQMQSQREANEAAQVRIPMTRRWRSSRTRVPRTSSRPGRARSTGGGPRPR